MHKAFQARRGFTLIELLLVIGIIAILASIVIVAINPTKQLGDARNAQRRSDVNTILSAVYQYAIDNGGNYPSDVIDATNNTEYEICICNDTSCAITGAALPACGTAVGRVNLRELTGSYLLAIPEDPRFASGASTEYQFTKLDSGRIKVCAPMAEPVGSADEICVTR